MKDSKKWRLGRRTERKIKIKEKCDEKERNGLKT
jgi:hypothetical protein